ncbi:MAG TPA: NADH-quinone oxidoreductase subunit J [Bacteroidia bacterium]|jgi:NADH-quinone oxidoreductase subunit J|nr:NADH-quinone oxidoreductase subunit J [Bacteroidia bacterium]
MSVTEIVFHLFVLLTAGAATALAVSRNVVYAAFLLFVVLIGVAGLYVFAGAEFLAVSQVIVYVGGTLIVVIFGVMLTAKIREMRPQTELVNVIPGALMAIGLFLALLFVIRESSVSQASPMDAVATFENTQRVGIATVTDYLLPFELVSVLLLTVLVGAAYLSRKTKTEKEGQGE